MSSIKIRCKRIEGKTEIRALVSHPMEHGLNRDKTSGELIPPHFIHTLTLAHNGEIIMTSYMGMSIAKDPLFIFMLKGGAVGDTITLSWEDNLGNSDQAQHTLT
jgi:sulfur-oxidizing protein SoxZ